MNLDETCRCFWNRIVDEITQHVGCIIGMISFEYQRNCDIAQFRPMSTISIGARFVSQRSIRDVAEITVAVIFDPEQCVANRLELIVTKDDLIERPRCRYADSIGLELPKVAIDSIRQDCQGSKT